MTHCITVSGRRNRTFSKPHIYMNELGFWTYNPGIPKNKWTTGLLARDLKTKRIEEWNDKARRFAHVLTLIKALTVSGIKSS